MFFQVRARGHAEIWLRLQKGREEVGTIGIESALVKTELLVRLISEGLEIVVGSRIGEEEEQAQELAVDAVRGRHASACQ